MTVAVMEAVRVREATGSLKTLGIKKGKKVFAVIKASNVMVGIED